MRTNILLITLAIMLLPTPSNNVFAAIDLNDNNSPSHEADLYGEDLSDDDFLPSEPVLEEPKLAASPAPTPPAAVASQGFAATPSTGVGSNTGNTQPTIQEVKPYSVSPNAAPQSAFNGSTRQQLEEAATKCTQEIAELYAMQKSVAANNMQKFQNRIGDAHVACEQIKRNLAKIRGLETEINKNETEGQKAITSYQKNISQVRETCN